MKPAQRAKSKKPPIRVVPILTALLAASIASGGPLRRLMPDLVIRHPSFVKIDSLCLCGDELYVTDKRSLRIFVFDAKGHLQRLLGQQTKKPIGIACTATGIAVVDAAARQILLMDRDGKINKTITAPKEHPFVKPEGIAVGPTDDLVVVDTDAGLVFIFDATGRYVRSFEGDLLEAESVVVDGSGTIYVADEGHHRIAVFKQDGTPVRTIGGEGSGGGRFLGDVEGLAIDKQGRLLALDEDEGVIEIFSPEGHPLARLGNGSGSGDGELYSPDGLIYDRKGGHLFVADQKNRRVLRFPYSD